MPLCLKIGELNRQKLAHLAQQAWKDEPSVGMWVPWYLIVEVPYCCLDLARPWYLASPAAGLTAAMRIPRHSATVSWGGDTVANRRTQRVCRSASRQPWACPWSRSWCSCRRPGWPSGCTLSVPFSNLSDFLSPCRLFTSCRRIQSCQPEHISWPNPASS